MFFPQLVAGPIERPQHLLPQLRMNHRFDYQTVTDGLKLMAWGFFQKSVIADRLALVVNKVYAAPAAHDGAALIVATVFFAFQIYCDFSGYSDIAVGTGEVMGFRLVRNFDRPYFARSIAEFWQRWHISLSTWFRDYVYIPLGGNKTSVGRWHFNILLTFGLSALWHGGDWTYLIWGMLHGFYYLCSFWTKPIRERIVSFLRIDSAPGLRRLLQTATTFTLVSFAWIFFRAWNNVDAVYIATHLFQFGTRPWVWGKEVDSAIGVSQSEFILTLALIGLVLCVWARQSTGRLRPFIARQPAWLRWGLYAAAVLAIMNLGVALNGPFIYFQF